MVQGIGPTRRFWTGCISGEAHAPQKDPSVRETKSDSIFFSEKHCKHRPMQLLYFHAGHVVLKSLAAVIFPLHLVLRSGSHCSPGRATPTLVEPTCLRLFTCVYKLLPHLASLFLVPMPMLASSVHNRVMRGVYWSKRQHSLPATLGSVD